MSAGQRMRRPPIATLAAWIIAPVLLALAALFVADRLYNPERFRIAKIEMRGALSRVDSGRIQAAVGQSLSGNFFSLSLPRIEARVEELPWVFSASVRRKWPATLVVEVTEVEPEAKWGKDYWLHASGDLVAREAASGAPVAGDLPRLSGPDGSHRAVWTTYRAWAETFAATGLRLDELRLDARGLWYLRVFPAARGADGARGNASPEPVVVIVPRENADARIRQLVAVLEYSLMAKFAAMRSVDLRHPNGFAVGWKAQTARPRLTAANG